MRLPHEQYIRFLITLNFDYEDVLDNISDLGLVSISKEYFDSQKAILHSTKIPKSIKDFWVAKTKPKLPKNFLSHMNAIGLQEAWIYNLGKPSDFKISLDVVQDSDVSIYVRSLIAAGVAPAEISALINGKFGMVFPENAVTIFQSYFFQPLIMSRKSWGLYLEKLRPEEKNLIYLGITGQQVVLRAELGLPVKISVSEHYQKLHIFAMQKFETYKKTNSPDADQNALKWAQLAMSSGDKYEKLKVGDVADFGRDIQMEFDFIDTDFPMIGEENLDEIKEYEDAGQNNNDADPIPLDLKAE